jgi:benzoyl-CoA reductase subunit B
MNVRLHLYPNRKAVKLKPHAVAKYCYYILIRFYYYFITFVPSLTALAARYIIHPLIFKKETIFNKRLRSAFLWVGGGLISARDYKAQRGGMRVMLDYLEGHIKPLNKKNKKPVVYLGWCVSPEFMRAFDAYYIIPEVISVAGSFMGQDVTHHILEVLEAEGGSMESCSASKIGAGAYFTQQLPSPDLIVTSSHPCDSGVAFYPTLQSLTKVPMYVLDTPYGRDEASYEYYARNIWGMIRFLETHLNQKMDWDRLKEACEELNKTNSYLQELTEMARAIPSPISGEVLTQSWAFKLMGSGSRHMTQCAKMMHDNAKARLERGEGWAKQEKIRIIWWDVPIAFVNLYPWLLKEFGAVVVGGDLMGRCNTPQVDISSEEGIINSMAKIHLNVSMARNVRGPYEFITDEFEQIIAEYSGDCFIFVGHNGCKHGWAASKMKKDICKRVGLPALFMSSDYADSRNMSEEALKKELSNFFISNGLA